MKKGLLITSFVFLLGLAVPFHVFADTDIYTPASGPNSPVDGHSYNENVNWTTARNAVTGASVNDTQTYFVVAADVGYGIFRGVTCFNTANLPDDATIDSATLELEANNNGSNDDSISYYLAKYSGQNNALQTSDYDLFTGLTGTITANSNSVTQASLSTGAIATFTLNTTGLLNIDKTGVSCFGIVTTLDGNNIAPVGGNGIQFASADHLTRQKPTLEVVYNTGGGGGQATTTSSTIMNNLASSIIFGGSSLIFSLSFLIFKFIIS